MSERILEPPRWLWDAALHDYIWLRADGSLTLYPTPEDHAAPKPTDPMVRLKVAGWASWTPGSDPVPLDPHAFVGGTVRLKSSDE